MKYEWDDEKAEKNFLKHGIEFSFAAHVFRDPKRRTEIDDRWDYGEVRENTIGEVNGLMILTVTHTTREGTVRIISARHASRQERKRYHGKNNQNDIG